MYCGKYLECFDTPEFCHRPLPPSKWLVGVFSPIIEPTTSILAAPNSDDLSAANMAFRHRSISVLLIRSINNH